MLGELVPLGGGDTIPLLRPHLTIGRRDGCDVALQFANVSSRHCELEFINGYWMVKDLNSSNGTKVNGVRVKSSWIFPGDELAIAKHRFKIDYDIAADAAPPPPLDNGENVQMSLLEKAGLARPERRPQRTAGPAAGASGKPAEGNRPGPADSARPPRTPPAAGAEEDRAFEWLQNDDE